MQVNTPGRSDSKLTPAAPARLWRLGPALLVILAIVLPPLLLIPLQLHSANVYDFSAGLPEVLPNLLVLVLFATTAGLALLLIVPARWYRAGLALAVGIAVFVWLQGQILVWDYGVLDGSDIDWWSYPSRILVDTLALIVVLALALIARRHVAARAGTIAFLVLIVQALPVAWTISDYPVAPEFHRFSFDEGSKFSFSSRQNVIIFVLDAYQSDIFQRIIDEDPDWKSELDGFTYFRNAVSGYSKTYPSLALMLSGQWYDNSQNIQTFVKKSFVDGSIPRELKRKGWRVDLFPAINRVVHVSPRVASNAVPVIPCQVIRGEAGKLVDLGMFRVSPHWFKPIWLNNHLWRMGRYWSGLCETETESNAQSDTSGDVSQHSVVRFVQEAAQLSDGSLQQPALKLYHLMVPHAPFQLNRDLEVVHLPFDSEGFLEQSRASLEVLRRFFENLRDLDVYDDSLIVVVSDHGGGRYTSSVDTTLLDAGAQSGNGEAETIPGHHHAAGLPLILIKPPADHGRLKISDAPVSLGDLARTMSEILGMGKRYSGRNMFDVDPDEQRTRLFYYYEFSVWSREFLPDMIEYQVDGYSWFPDNWSATGRVLSPAASAQELQQPVLRLADRVHFRSGSSYTPALVRGWSDPQANGLVWSRSAEAVIEFELSEEVQGPVVARFDFMPFTAGGEIVSPTVELIVNGDLPKTWSTEKRGWHQVQIPAEVINSSNFLEFKFRFPDAASPFEFGRSLDARKLGIALFGIELDYVRDDAG